jgi:hypothetical protein
MSRATDFLRNVAGDTRVSLTDLADRLDDIVERHPDAVEVVDLIAYDIDDMPSTPYVSAPTHRWSWPRPEWSDWQDSVREILEGVPGVLWRSLIIHLPSHPGAWAQIVGIEGDLGVRIYDPTGAFSSLAPLAWEQVGLSIESQGRRGVYWQHEYPMKYTVGTVDRLAQALALAVGIQSPRDIVMEDLDFGHTASSEGIGVTS